MIKEHLYAKLFNKIPQNARVAIFGACPLGSEIFKDILINRKDVDVNCFIDNNKEGEFRNLPILKLQDIVNQKANYDMVIVASMSAQYLVLNILDIYDIPFIPVDRFIMDYYEGKNTILNDTNYNKILNIFSDDKDKELFDMLFQGRADNSLSGKIADYFNEKFPTTKMIERTVRNQYIDKIIKEKVKIIFDLGYNSGINALAYNRFLPNCKHIYGFEPIYEICRRNEIESLLPKDKITVVNSAVGEVKGKTNFYINNDVFAGSFADFSSIDKNINRNIREITADVTTIDDFCKENKVYPDLIKMDVEGSELLALKGGINAIRKARPQLAISSYHSNSDFINIPIYLHENLENYTFKLGQYAPFIETIVYAIPKEYIGK